MANHTLSANFSRFFSNLNPSPSFEKVASREYGTIKGLLEASDLEPCVFLQGSYRQDTAIHSINDVDIVALCDLWQPGGGSGRSWSRDEIFDAVAAPLLQSGNYKGKVRYGQTSMCIKVDLGIKVEILPVVFRKGNSDPTDEPFRLYRPRSQRWEDGFARKHQSLMTAKNQRGQVGGNFKPMVKVMKHVCSVHGVPVVSFHLECLLYGMPDEYFTGSPPDYIAKVLAFIARYDADAWYRTDIATPCRDRSLFTSTEWALHGWNQFHRSAVTWAKIAHDATQQPSADAAVNPWKALLGEQYFPRNVAA